MSEDQRGRELTPREPGEVETSDAALTPVEGERRDVERFSAGPRAHSVGLTEERSAQIVRQSASSRNVVFLAILLIALFIPVYWFYENGVAALGTDGRMVAEAEAQYVTDIARGYELYLANCAECHGEEGQGGIGPRLNDQGKLYNALTPAGDPGTGHLNPNYLENVLVVGGRYVCGDPDSLMASWQDPNGPLNYRQVEELILWLNASQDVVFTPHGDSHGESDEEHSEPESVSGWTDEQKSNYGFSDWWNNVTNPGCDSDDFFINYVTHPYWGAAYYVRASERGYDSRGAFWYAVLLSSLYEFGAEALFEEPSVQDLIVTPTVGSLVGHYFMGVRNNVRAQSASNGYRTTGQKWVMVLTDPLGALNRQVDKLFGHETSLQIYPYFYAQQPVIDPGASRIERSQERVIGLRVHLRW